MNYFCFSSALDYDLQVCVASILENYSKEEWPEMVFVIYFAFIVCPHKCYC